MLNQIISHYRIVEKLGAGGMGVVYKAEDLKLGRAVALKFLSAQLLESEEHKTRFLHEAQAAALLDHPNICTVYEIDEVDGQTFLAMALLEGRTLNQKIAVRPLPLEEALDIATQIAQGLQAAHEKGIVHRDIKPANIMITAPGPVKIMDFGLAQLSDRTKLTASGTRLGTPAYMSPEQAQGKAADRRSDIWALGVVLYEMISGRVPFAGEVEGAVAYAILHSDPEPLTAVRSDVPIELDRIAAKALAKEPIERYQHVDEFASDLRRLIHKPQPASQRSAKGRLTGGRFSMRERISWGLAAFLLGLCVWLFLTARHAPVVRPRRATVFSIVPRSTGPSAFGNVALPPDGGTIAFTAVDASGTRKLWLRQIDSPEAQPLEGTSGAEHSFWSPDGRSIAFMAGQKLRRMEVPGGAPIDICAINSGRGGTWNAAGLIVLQPTSREPLYVVPAAGGEPSPATELSAERSENSHRFPHFLPDGRHFLYTARATPENTAIYVGSLDSKQAKRILTIQSDGLYAPAHDGVEGQLLFVRDRNLFAQTFDPQTLTLRGEAVAIARDLTYARTGSHALFTVSGDGRVLGYVRGGARAQDLIWLDRDGNRVRVFEGAGNDAVGLRLSPDGNRAMVSRPDPYGGNRDLWVVDLASGSLERYTTDPANDWIPVWSLHDNRVLFASDRKGGANSLYTQPSSGAAQATPLVSGGVAGSPEDWSADGKYVAFHDEPFDLPPWILPLQGDGKPIPFAQNRTEEQDLKFSPDGRWVAYTSRVSGQFEIYLHAMEDALSGRAARSSGKKVSLGGGAAARWRRDGKELFYIRPDETLMSVEIGPAGAASPKALFRTCRGSFAPEYYAARYDTAPDGQHFLFNCNAERDAEPEIQVVVNWTAGLAGRAP
jgi:Tol biopolymer transport system component/tRNA A-37 threonylcarbamoyl transferase component Bud32